MTPLRSALYFVVGFMLALVAGLAAAQTTGTYWTLNQNTQPRYSKGGEACAALGYVGAGTFSGYSPPVTGASYCYKYVNGSPVIGPDYAVKHTVTCGANQTYDPATYACVENEPPPEEEPSGCTAGETVGDESTVTNSTCSGGCGMTPTASSCGGGSCNYYGPFTNTGAQCTPADGDDFGTPEPPPEEPGDGGDTGGGDDDDPDEGGDGADGACPDGQTWVPGTSGGAGSCVNSGGDGDGGGSTGGDTGGGGGGGTGDGEGDGTGDGTGDGDGEGECTGDDCEEGGTPAEIGDIYQKKEKTVGQVFQRFQQKIGEAPFVAAAGGFFSVSASGSCPTWSRSIPMLGTIVIDHFCSSTALYWLGIAGYAILALASFTAFRWAFL